VLLSAMGLGTGKSLLISIPIAVILTAFVTPESVIGIFKSYDTTSLTIATILPLLIFFALTYVSVVKESRTLMTIQIISWGIFFFYNAVKFVFGGGLQFLGIYSGGKWNMFTDLPLWGTTEGDWFWGATFIQGIIAALMFFKNGLFMNWAIKMTAGIDKGKADLTARDVETAVNFLKNVEKTATKER